MNKVDGVIEFLSSIDLESDLSYEQIILGLENRGLEIPFLTYRVEKDTTVFRTRENRSIDFFKTFDEISSPKRELVTTFNRVNRPQQSIFYCSDSRKTSYSEFIEDWAEFPNGATFNITIGKWRISDNLRLLLICDRERLKIKDLKLNGIVWDTDHDNTYDFLVAKFIKSAHSDKSIYILTSAIANTLFLRSDCDGLIYPCIPTNGDGFNLALKSEVYKDGKIKLESVLKETFQTCKADGLDKPIHVSIDTIEGRIDHDNRQISW